MKTIIRSLLFAAVIIFLNFLHAQTTDWNSASDLEVLLQAVEQTPIVSADSLPQSGTFWSAQHAPGSAEEWPPMPADLLGLNAWSLGDGVFLLNDTNVDYVELQAEATAAAPKTRMSRMSMMMSSLATGYAYGNPIYITNFAANVAYDGSMTANFSIGGGTNFVPYDILMTTNLMNQIATWTWLGIGYTSNNYTFYEQPSDLGFYILAKPQRTMVIAWGDNSSGQCDVPAGLTNAIQVTGGAYHSIALLNNSNLVAWGDDSYGQTDIPAGLTNAVVITANGFHNLALRADGTPAIWGDWYFSGYYPATLPSGLTNITAVAAGWNHDLAVNSNGTVIAWGYASTPYTAVPSNLPPAMDVAAGMVHSVALLTNGIVVAWGENYDSLGETNVPAGLSNVVAIAAGDFHTLALKSDGTVVAWGAGESGLFAYGQSTVPAGLSNVVAIAAGGYHSMALKSDGTVVMWGDMTTPSFPLNQIIGIGFGWIHALVLRTGNSIPLMTGQPTDQYAPAGQTVNFSASAIGLAALQYQWQFNGVNISGATNTTLTLTNVQPANEGVYDAVASFSDGSSSIVSSNANFYLVTPPVITWQSTPTNYTVIYGNLLSFAATATAPYQANGFPLTYQWLFNGTNIFGGTNFYNFSVTDNSSGIYSLVVSNAAGFTNLSWFVTVTNTINVTNDLLLIYNSNSVDSSNLCAYYLAHRPMVAGANVLGVACDTNEITSLTNYINQIATPILNWLTNNPTKRPQYVVLFYGVPTRLSSYPTGYGSVSYNLHNAYTNWQPFVNNINAGSLADCEAYVDKIASFGSNYSPGQLIISANTGGYGNTNFVLDNVRHGPGFGDGGFTGNGDVVSDTISAITNFNPDASISYIDGVETTNIPFLPHITNGVNVAGYVCWGGHSDWGTTLDDGNFPLDGNVKWSGNSDWWIIATIESFNGQRDTGSLQSNFEKWYSSNAFGGTNYSNTPIGAVSHTEEPGLPSPSYSATYFGLWAAEKNFAICAWSARDTVYFQAVGDPFVVR